MGIQSEVGRSAGAYKNTSSLNSKLTEKSVFDPVLCELAYKWFCPPQGHILDPFAGGSVRGIVASALGFKYTGIDLSKTQVEENRSQARTISSVPMPNWIVGDSLKVVDPVQHKCDFIFSCPPYGDLEKYSTDPRDISNMTYAGFMTAYKAIIAKCCGCLRDNSFAAFVVGDFRDKKTECYRGFVHDTVKCFEAAGLGYYNHSCIVNPLGTLAMRAGLAFRTTRKLGSAFQDMIVMLKGDAREAVKKLGSVEKDDLSKLKPRRIVGQPVSKTGK